MTINGSTNNSNWTYKLEVSETGYSVQDRTSTIQVKTYLGRASSQSYLGGNYSNSVSITGASSQSQSGNIPYPTYINGGAWLLLKTFTFTVPNTGNPTTVTISSSFSSSDFTPSSASASGTMQLTILHLDPVINTATMVETNSVLTALNVPDTTVVRYLSKKRITLNVTAFDGATLTYKLRHLNTDYTIPTSGYQSSNVFNVDYTQNDIMLTSNNKAPIIQEVKDSLNGTATDYLFVTINNSTQRPDGIPYTKPTIERTNTYIKRKSGDGTTLTDNKAVLNFKGTFYKGNDVIGNNNNIQQIGYKLWEKGTSEPSSYTPLTPTISGGTVTISNLELTNLPYTKTYNYKFIFKDRYGYEDTILDGTLPTGQSVWTEYKDRVDFLALTVKNENPFALMRGGVMTYKKWVYLCNITFTNHIQGAFTAIRIYIGRGNNGEPNQNAYLDLSMQMGWNGSYDGRCGCLAELNKCLTSFTLENIKLKIIANDNHNYDIYFYESLEDFCAPNYIVLKNDKATITSKNQVLNSEPTGTECQIRYMYANNEVYDTSEAIIGTWLNKPLYRKTFKFENGIASGDTSHSHGISNIDTIFINSGKSFLFNTDNGKTCMLPINQYNNAETFDQVDVYADRSNIYFMAKSGWGTYWNAYITLEYTKTTD